MITVRLKPKAAEQVDQLPKGIDDRVRKKIKTLENWPMVGKFDTLEGKWDGCYRVRVGAYRIIFRVSGRILTVEKIGNRKDIYEN